VSDKSKIAADLAALAAQEGHDGEDWDLIQDAADYIRKLEKIIYNERMRVSVLHSTGKALVADLSSFEKKISELREENADLMFENVNLKRQLQPFPMQNGPNITQGVAEVIYAQYSRLYGIGQSFERIAERGGFGWHEVELLFKRR
jgi:regulator of replication initiation timing